MGSPPSGATAQELRIPAESLTGTTAILGLRSVVVMGRTLTLSSWVRIPAGRWARQTPHLCGKGQEHYS